MKFHKDGTVPKDGEVFVFGSNLAGIHGAGAALEAKKNFGAKQGQGRGYWGNSYAIPTKDVKINTLAKGDIKGYINDFISFAGYAPNLEFWVTAVGCGLAGYKDADIAPYFKGAPNNCNFPLKWKKYL